LLEVLIGDVEESVDFLIGAHSTFIGFQLGKKLIFGGFVMIETELAGEEVVEFVLSLLEEVFVTSTHPFEFILGNLGLPGSKFLFSSLQLSLKRRDGTGDRLERDNKFLILGLNFSAGSGEGILVKTGNVGVKTLDIGLEGNVELGNLDKLGVKLRHLGSEVVLVGVPGLKHLSKFVTDNFLVGLLGLSLTLSFGPFGQGSVEGIGDIGVLGFDDGKFVVHSDLLLLREDKSSEEVHSPVEVLIEHPKGLVSFLRGLESNVDSSGLTTSGLDFLLDQVSHLTFTIEFVLIKLAGPSIGFSFINGGGGLLENFLLVRRLPTSHLDVDGGGDAAGWSSASWSSWSSGSRGSCGTAG
jgi:hypothetical protein